MPNRGRCLPKGRCGSPSNQRDSGSESQGGQHILWGPMAVGDAADKLGRGGEEIAREKSERPRGNERGLGGKTEEPVTQTAGAWGGQRGAEKCVRQTAGEEGKKRKERDWGEGLPPAPEHFPGQEEGECSLPVQRCRPEPR